MTRSFSLGLATLALLSGCNVSAVGEAPDQRPNNACSSDSDCDGDSNQKCGSGVCQSTNGKLESLLIAVTPPSNSSAPHLTFVTHVQDVPTRGGGFELPVLRAAAVTGSLALPAKDDCYPTLPQDGPVKPLAGNSLPVSVVLLPRERLLGLPQQLYLTSAHLQEDGTYKYFIEVPPGDYDVYMTLPDQEHGPEDCVVPPQLVRAQSISGETMLRYEAAPRSYLNLHIKWPKSNPALTGWTADIIEPLGGIVISNEVTLGDPYDALPADPGTPLDYKLPLVYSTVSQMAKGEVGMEPIVAADLVRLRPPPGTTAPAIFLDRSAFSLLGTPEPTFEAFTHYPAPVKVESRIQGPDGAPVDAQVTLISTEIAGMDAGVFASFQQTVEVDKSGLFNVDLPPGKYRVNAVPSSSGSPDSGSLSSLAVSWEIPADVKVQAGRLLEPKAGVGIRGFSVFEGATIQVQPSGATIEVQPSGMAPQAPASPRSILPFDQAIGSAPFVPRARSALVESGQFVVDTDPGMFDVSVRAPESLGFGWYVRPGIKVRQDREDLGRLPLPVPTVLTGTATAAVSSTATNPVAFAAVSAFAYLDVDGAYTRDLSQAFSVVQVAETRADETGAFRLLVPSELFGPK